MQADGAPFFLGDQARGHWDWKKNGEAVVFVLQVGSWSADRGHPLVT